MPRHESSPSAPALEAAVARLFSAPFGEFTEVRKALVKELRADGARAAADEVAKAKRPTRAAWALNQVARRKPEEVASFIDAAKQGREAQSRAIGQSDAGALREVGRAMGESASRILKLASEVIAEDGGQVSTALARTINATLRSIPFASREDVERFRQGNLVGDFESPGDFEVLGSVSGAAPAPEPRRELRKEPNKEAAKASVADAKAKARTAAAAEREKREQARRAEAEAERQRRHIAKLEQAAEDAESEAARLERAAAAAEAHARATEKEAKAARSKATEARSELARVRKTARLDA